MKIVVLDGYAENPGDLSWEDLESPGELTAYDGTPEEQVVECIGRAEAVYINKVPIGAQTIKSYPNLRFIGVPATGYSMIGTHTAREAGVAVSSIPSYGTDTMTQYAIALLLELCHRTDLHADCVKAGGWTRCKNWCFWKYPLTELAGKTTGIIGFGRIGRRTTVIAEALSMKVLVYDRYQDKDLKVDNRRYVGLEELPAYPDVISLHCPLFPETEKIINRQTIAKMRKGVPIINTSKGKLVKEADLRGGLNSGKIGGAAVDMVSTESIQGDNPPLGTKSILIMPHIAWVPGESRQRLMDIAAENLIQFMTGTPRRVVNKL